MEAKNVLLIGATGLIGTHILEALIQSKDSFNRVAIYTSPATEQKKPTVLDGIRKRGVEVIVGEVGDEKKVEEAYQGRYLSISARRYARYVPILTMPFITYRNRHRNQRPGPRRPRVPTHPHKTRLLPLFLREMVLPLRIRDRHRVLARVRARASPPDEAEDQSVPALVAGLDGTRWVVPYVCRDGAVRGWVFGA